MDIYVVQPGDDINSIAVKYGVSADSIIRYNELRDPEELVTGQTLVITHPKQTYTVMDGDTLQDIANAFGVTTLQLLKNNPFLSDRKYIFPGEELVISYNTTGQLITNGFAYPYIKKETLLKTLPNLTYLTVFNYRAGNKGEITALFDDTDTIQTALEYAVVPLMMISIFTPTGEADVEAAFNILLNEEYQNHFAEDTLNIIKSKGYYGVNMIFDLIDEANQPLYEKFLQKIADRIRSEGYLLFVTINPDFKVVNNQFIFHKVDYTEINTLVDRLIFLNFIWGSITGPPAPVSNNSYLQTFLEYAIPMVSPDKTSLGKQYISYDWELPYVPGKSVAYSLTIDSALALAYDTGASILYDEVSQTPYFFYRRISLGTPADHIVWSIDARSIKALIELIGQFNLSGTDIWNIMVYYSQLWLVINAQYGIVKVIPEKTILS